MTIPHPIANLHEALSFARRCANHVGQEVGGITVTPATLENCRRLLAWANLHVTTNRR